LAALAVGQILAWAALYYGISSFVLPTMAETGWSKPLVMGVFTLGLGVSGLATYASGAAIDRGHGRAPMTAGALLAAACFAFRALAREPWVLYAAWALGGAALAMTLYEPAFAVLANVVRRAADRASRRSRWRLASRARCPWALRGPAIVAPAVAAHDAAAAPTLRQALRTRPFWWLTLAFTLYSFVAAGLWAHVIPAFAAKGVGEAQALAVLVWIGPAQVAGRVIFAWVGGGRGLPGRRRAASPAPGSTRAYLSSSRIVSFSRRIWKRDRKLLPSST
jgi:hypothetical protein